MKVLKLNMRSPLTMTQSLKLDTDPGRTFLPSAVSSTPLQAKEIINCNVTQSNMHIHIQGIAS